MSPRQHEVRTQNFVIVTRGRHVAAVGLGHDQQDAVVALQVAVTQTGGAAVLHASDLHPDQVIGVIHDAHLVGFGVADAQACLDGIHKRL